MTTRTLRAAAACALLATTCLVAPAQAQSIPSAYPNVDANGVDLTDGSFNFSLVEGSIGSGEGALSLVRFGVGGSSLDNWSGLYLYEDRAGSGTVMTVALGNRSEGFTKDASGGFTARQSNGATLTGSGSNYVYRNADGTTISFGPPVEGDDLDGFQGCNDSNFANCRLPALSVAEPSGKTTTLTYDVHRYVERTTSGPGPETPLTAGDGTPGEPTPISNSRFFWRLKTVSNNFGYAMDVAYLPDGLVNNQASPDWYRRSGASFRNAALGTGALSQVGYATEEEGNILAITTAPDRVWRIRTDSAKRIIGIRRPGASGDSTIIGYGPGGVTQVTKDGVATRYNRAVSEGTSTTTVTNAEDRSGSVVTNLATGRPTRMTDVSGRTTTMEYDADARLTRMTAPDGIVQRTVYDARGNVVESGFAAKPIAGQTTPEIVTKAGFPETCGNQLTCNQPAWTRDAAGNQTDYAYDGIGNLVAVSAPAPTSGAVRPQTRYTYAAVGGVSMLTEVRMCQTRQTCADTADEVGTYIAYDTPNLQPSSIATKAGDNSVSTVTGMTYDEVGNLVTVDGPLATVNDVSRAYYNASREVIGSIGPDPDGAGPLKHRAQKMTRNADGQVTRVDGGTAGSIGDDGLAKMTILDSAMTEYDANGRVIRESFESGAVVANVTQWSYDALGRTSCAAQRMKPPFSDLPADACAHSDGAGIPDRITKMSYDALGRPTARIVAVGTPDEATEVAAIYDADGRLETLVDGENNRTRYVYDGFGRLATTYYPTLETGPNASTFSFFEGLTYDVRGNVVSRRLRDGRTIALTYDALGRLTRKDVPGGAPHEYDATYAYDNLGRLTTAADDGGTTVRFGYDALGRKISETTGSSDPTRSEYDAAGRRTKLTHPDGFFVAYDYLATGEMTSILENGALTLATFSYDDLGRRTRLVRGNGTETRYAHDPVSRLTMLAQDLKSVAHNLTLEFGYNAAGQIASATRDNDAYAWRGGSAGTVTSPVNPLNQLTRVGAAAVAYDQLGNLTSDGTRTYGYTSENRLASAPGSTLAYDPVGRLSYLSASGTQLGYDGTDIIGESGTGDGPLRRRYVHGPGTDEPLVWYEGTGDRRYLHADERGSIVAVSDNAGKLTAINTYDEYGKPGAGNVGRFQYTGQAWLPEAGVYSYKARMYDPRLGRFLQTDPIGYEAGMNLYGYVGGDPVNFTDPSGLCPDGEHSETVTGSRIRRCVPDGQRGGVAPGLSPGFLGVAGGSGGVGGSYECVKYCGDRPAAPSGQIVVYAPPLYGFVPSFGNILGSIRLYVRDGLNNFADNYLMPPAPRQSGETYARCVMRVSGISPAAFISGLSGIAVGAGNLGYPRMGFGGGGNGSSLTSYAARASFGKGKLQSGRFGTGSRGGAFGRAAATTSAAGGAAIAGFALGATLGALQICY